MREQRFQKVVEVQSYSKLWTGILLLLNAGMPFYLSSFLDRPILGIPAGFILFVMAINLLLGVGLIINFVETRKIYWRKI